MSYDLFCASPTFYQGFGAPSSVGANLNKYIDGFLQFYWDLTNSQLYVLKSIDFNTSDEVWLLFPTDALNLYRLGGMAILNHLIWFTGNEAPISELNNSVIFDGTFGMYWWNKSSGEFFSLTSYNNDGTNLVWSLVAS